MFKRNNNNNNRFAGPMNQFPNQAFQQPGFNPQMMQQGMPGGMQQGMPGGMQPESALYPQVNQDRLQFEIKENRRRINNLTRRIIRLENYLRIRDTSDYVNIDDDQLPNEFSM